MSRLGVPINKTGHESLLTPDVSLVGMFFSGPTRRHELPMHSIELDIDLVHTNNPALDIKINFLIA